MTIKTKICTKCKDRFPLTEFKKASKNKSGLSSWCKECARQASHAWSVNNRAKERIKYKKYYIENRKKILKKSKEWGETHREQVRARMYRNLYGISIQDYAQLLIYQGGVCGGCRIPGRSLQIDHSHNSGLVRGLLCFQCNAALGLLGDNLEVLKNLAEYLSKKTNKEVVL